MNRAVSFWNGQNGRFVYVVGRGRSAVAYSVRFNVTTATDDRPPVQNRFATPFYSKGDELSFNDATGEVNSYNVLPDSSPRFAGYEDRVAGVNEGRRSFVKCKHRNDNTGAHEVGHGMWAIHMLMEA